MSEKIHTIELSGTVHNFKSQIKAFQFLIEQKLIAAGFYHNAKQQQILADLTKNGTIKYTAPEIKRRATGKKIDFNLEKEVKQYIDGAILESVSKVQPKELHLIVDGKKVKTVEGLHHFSFETVLKCLAAHCNPMLVGPAGSGKTTCVEKAAHALDLKFYAMSVGLQTSKVEFMGYMDATGTYVRTLFREAYEKGGVFLIDEIDAGNPGIMTIINAALANGICAFPDKMIKKHKDFLCCAAANTFGKGADRMYVGRNQLDAATLDRFVKLNFDYDEVLESKLATNANWFQLIRDIRKTVFDKKLRVLVTPRATFYGCALLEQGLSFWDCLELTLFNGCSEDEKNIIMAGASLNKAFLQARTNKTKGARKNGEVVVVELAETE